MKKLFVVLLLLCTGTTTALAQGKPAATKPAAKTVAAKTVATPDPSKPVQVVEASCGECRLGLKGDGCDLAVRTNGKAYFLEGTGIDSHGDSHADDGFCNAVRRAEVQGTVVNNRFVATYFRLLPAPTKTK